MLWGGGVKRAVSIFFFFQIRVWGVKRWYMEWSRIPSDLTKSSFNLDAIGLHNSDLTQISFDLFESRKWPNPTEPTQLGLMRNVSNGILPVSAASNPVAIICSIEPFQWNKKIIVFSFFPYILKIPNRTFFMVTEGKIWRYSKSEKHSTTCTL